MRTFASLLTGMVGATLLTCLTPAWALYKVVGPDGKVTYTDRAPAQGKVESLKLKGQNIPSVNSLPYALAQVVNKYPVMLYTSSDCTPCAEARSALNARGVPFIEKTVNTAEDIAALKQREGRDSVPVIRIGQQRLNGFNRSELTTYLDNAGYPKESQLPRNYQQAAAQPLADRQAVKLQTSSDGTVVLPRNNATDNQTPSIKPPPTPGGIQF